MSNFWDTLTSVIMNTPSMNSAGMVIDPHAGEHLQEAITESHKKSEVKTEEYRKLDPIAEKEADDRIEIARKRMQQIYDDYTSGKITEESIRDMFKGKDIDPKEVIDFCKGSNLDHEKNPLTKTDLSEVPTIGANYHLAVGEVKTISDDCKIKCIEYTGKDLKNSYNAKSEKFVYGDKIPGAKSRKIYHCESKYLGNFDYDPEYYRIGYKEITERDGSVSKLPVLEYIGPNDINVKLDSNDWNEKYQNVIESCFHDTESIVDNIIPKNVENLDYTFCQADWKTKEFAELYPNRGCIDVVPTIPEKVTSMNMTFANNENITVFSDMNFGQAWSGKDKTTKICELPSTLACAQGAFKNCRRLEGTFVMRNADENGNVDKNQPYLDQLPSGVVNIIEMFSGCDFIDKQYQEGYDTWFSHETEGNTYSKAVFDADKCPYLSSFYTAGVYDFIDDSTIDVRNYHEGKQTTLQDAHYKDDYTDQNIDEQGNIKTNTSDLNQSKLDAVAAMSLLQYNGKVASGEVTTNVDVVSGGQRSHNLVKDENENFKDDQTGGKKTNQDLIALASDTSAWWEQFAKAGAIGLGAKLLGESLTKNSLIGWSAAIGSGYLAYTHLPGGLYPIVHTLADIFNSEKLESFAKKLPGAEAYIKNEEIRKRNAEIEKQNAERAESNKECDNKYYAAAGIVDGNIDPFNSASGKGSLATVFNNATSVWTNSFYADKFSQCKPYVVNNAQYAASQYQFAGLAAIGDSTVIKNTIATVTSEANAYFDKKIEDPNNVSDSVKKELRDYTSFLVRSISAYSDAAMSVIEGDSDAYVKAVQQDGLAMTNVAYVEVMMNSLTSLDAKYHFMDEATWSTVLNSKVEGIDMKSLKACKTSDYFNSINEELKAKTEKDVDAAVKNNSEFADCVTYYKEARSKSRGEQAENNCDVESAEHQEQDNVSQVLGLLQQT